tara:strand:- start:40 stop:315 length:276 start_codon:yes stop_codon:yes gene_type:complete
MLRVKVPRLDKNDMISDQLKDYIENVKLMDPLSELKKDMGKFLSEIDITENNQLIDFSKEKSIVTNNSKTTKKSKGQLLDNLIDNIVNSNM